jgi:twinkle protein
MAEYLRDTIDFAAFERSTDPQVRVRKASVFVTELLGQFADRDQSARRPEMLSTKLRSCIEFRPAEVTAWAGYNGHRKSMFTGQVALDLCVQRQRVLCMSLEMQPERTLARMARQAAGSARLEPAQVLAFSTWTDGKLWLFDHVGRLTPHATVAVCRYFAEELQGQHVFIDSMMMVCGSEESLDEQKQFVTDLVRLAHETGLHIHLVTHCRKPQTGDDTKPPTKYDLRGSAAISDQCHNVVTVWVNKAKAIALQKDPHDATALDKPDVRVCVEKQRNGEFEGAVGLWWHKASMRFVDERHTLVPEYDFMKGA